MMKKLWFSLIMCLLAAVAAGGAEPGPHPRLITGPFGHLFSEAELSEAPSWIRQADSVVWAFSDAVTGKPPVERIKTGKRLLDVSREALKRIFYLSYTYRVHGGDAYARRAIDEMLAVSSFQDWNPSHFLDVGEMVLGLSIGYDWLYGAMTPDERKTVACAILEKGFDASDNAKDAWFLNVSHNWNSVCNAGLVFGAAALWDEYPDRCGEILRRSLKSNQKALKAFSDEGGYPEGYNYWGYGVAFQALLLDALETAFGTDFGLLDTYGKGFLSSARFMQFMSTPAFFCFNFSDSAPGAVAQPIQAWMALKTGDMSLLYPEVKAIEKYGLRSLGEDRLLPFFLAVMSRMPALPSDGDLAWPPVPSGHVYTCGGETPLFIYRSGWESASDSYLGVKGGLSMSSHSHCDQGSFIFESDGVRWAADLGIQSYYSLEKLGLDLWNMTQYSDRWEVFRIGPFSHNILTVNGNVPKINHPAAIVRTWDRKGRYGAGVDLGEIYSEDLSSYRREVWTDGKGGLHVRDYIETGDSLCTVRWAMCTAAEARIVKERRGREAFELTAGGVRKCLTFNIKGEYSEPEGGPVAILSASAPGPYLHDYDAPNPGMKILCRTIIVPPRTRVRLEAVLR